ncbi:hypothetical protein PMAYCL1PPCAC_32625, partial [Pristionchus mayeri]
RTTTATNGNYLKDRDVEKLIAENEAMIHDKISEGDEEEEIFEGSSALQESMTATKDSYLTDDQLNKLQDREQSEFMNDLISALKCESNPSLNLADEPESPIDFPSSFPSTSFTLKPSISLDFPRVVQGRFMRVSNTLQVVSKTPRGNRSAFNSISSIDRDESDIKLNGRCSSSTSKDSPYRPSKPIPSSSSSRNHSSSSTPVSSFSDHSWRRLTGTHTDSMSLIQHEFVDSSDNEEGISYL